MIATNYEGGLFAITSGNTRKELAPAGSSLIGINGIHLYYAIAFEGGMELYRVRLDGLDTVSLGSVTLPSPELGLPSVGSALVRDDGIYFTCGCYGGTGNFFNGGGVYRINFDGGIDTLVDPYGERQVNFPKIYIADTEAGEILYYYCGDGYSNAGFWDSWVAEDVYGLNLETAKIFRPISGFPVSATASVWTAAYGAFWMTADSIRSSSLPFWPPSSAIRIWEPTRKPGNPSCPLWTLWKIPSTLP